MDYSRLNLECSKCGKCCCGFSEDKGVILFPDDITRIANELNISSEIFKTKYCYSRKLITKKKILKLLFLNNIGDRCIFLNKHNLCMIYEFKPIQCQKAPFYFFWDEKERFNYDCARYTKVPENWSTDDEDFKLIRTLFKD